MPSHSPKEVFCGRYRALIVPVAVKDSVANLFWPNDYLARLSAELLSTDGRGRVRPLSSCPSEKFPEDFPLPISPRRMHWRFRVTRGTPRAEITGDISLFPRFNAGKSLRPQVQEALLQKAVATQRQPRLHHQLNAMGRIRQFHLRSVWSSLGKAVVKN
jgi:hypothetical protein